VNYSKDEFYDLMEQVEAAGGEHLDEMCKMRSYEFCGDKLPDRAKVLPGCGESALFTVPYKTVKKNSMGDVLVDSEIKVCAVDDDMGRWPRFGGDRFGRDEE
jgi:hypothetical protein